MVKKLILWIAFWGLMASGLWSCGKITEKGEAGSLTVSLKIPEGEIPELFWLGVEKRELLVEKQGETVVFPWSSGQEVSLEVREGDKLTFQGYDFESRPLVTGETTVGPGKTSSILLRRVL